MPNPWDIELPVVPDEADTLTFEWVGRACSNWEAAEFRLSILYSVFAGGPLGKVMQDYGAGRIFRERLAKLKAKAETHFSRHPNQDIEGKFHQVTVAAEGFSERRNEIAHGIVFNVASLRLPSNLIKLRPRKATQFALLPPYYAVRNHAPLPLYAYSAPTLRRMCNSFRVLGEQARYVSLQIAPREVRSKLRSPYS
jgi:hypothetical protein